MTLGNKNKTKVQFNSSPLKITIDQVFPMFPVGKVIMLKNNNTTFIKHLIAGLIEVIFVTLNR